MWVSRVAVPASAALVVLCAILVAFEASRPLHGLLETGTPVVTGAGGPRRGRGHFEVAVVLGYALEADGQPTFTLRRRVDRGIELLLEGVVDYVLFSGGHNGRGLQGRPSEAESMLEYALNHKNPRLPLRGDPTWLLEEESTSTRTNALETLKMLREHDLHSVVVVTSEFHQYRAGRVFRQAAREIAAREGDEHPIPVHVVNMGSVPWTRAPRNIFLLNEEVLNLFNFLRELAAIALYTVRGWI